MAPTRNVSPKRGQGIKSQAPLPTEEIHVCIDKEVPEELQALAAQLSVIENAENAPKLPFGATPSPAKLALITGNKWQPGRVLNCFFMKYNTPNAPQIEAKVISYAKQWEQYANIKLNFNTTQNESDIRIAFIPDGSWSFIGTGALAIRKDSPTINFGWLDATTTEEEYSRVVLHEFGHALGCIHEHQNPVANIPWDKPAVYKYYMGPPNGWSKADVDHNLFEKYATNITQFSAWDSTSIMHYAIPKALTGGLLEVPWNTVLSETDKSFIAEMYPGANPGKDLQYARKLYNLILNRQPSEVEAQAVANQITAYGRNVVVQGIERSSESTNRIVYTMYSNILQRPPTAADSTAFYQAVQKNITEEQFVSNYLASDEYFIIHGSNAENWFKSIYAFLLNRQPPPEDVSKWVAFVNTYGRYKVAMDLCTSPEHRGIVIKEYFQKILLRVPPLSDIVYWINSQLDLARIRYAMEASSELYNKDIG